ncbi:Qat anti-phage system QueC-like protein QatC [Stenotrophomonas nitritireducens]|uniref:Qat anti-phage system QueC-like protein QatC n=1 Tax=Stenotrophomonas nitritireducens TaxID=83617 RepID=UPI003D957349
MSRQSIVFRVGADDRLVVATRLEGSHATEFAFDGFADIDRLLGGVLSKLERLGLQPSERSLDLAMLAAAITAADTRVERSKEGQDGWTRELEICLPVHDQEAWLPVVSLLERTLNFLTGDRWTVTFRPRSPSAARIIEPLTETLAERPTDVCLFSGGLDSFIGAIDLLSEGKSVLLVSHYWDSVTSKHQDVCLNALEERYKDVSFFSVRARVGFETGAIDGSWAENTLRARSFLFFSLAALAADAIGRNVTIHVPENGLISLNVPLDPLRLGSLSTRTTHPYYMSRFNELLRAIGLGGSLHNSYRHMTKGEMVEECEDIDFLREHAKETISCSSPAKARFSADEERRKPKNCGHCVPCLIRRAALKRGFGQDDTEYQLEDLENAELDSKSAEGEHVRSFQLAISRLRTKPGRARFDIHKPGPLIDFPDDWGDYEAVYRDGLEEVADLLQNVEARPLE